MIGQKLGKAVLGQAKEAFVVPKRVVGIKPDGG
jgi:hypothetical protein